MNKGVFFQHPCLFEEVATFDTEIRAGPRVTAPVDVQSAIVAVGLGTASI